MVGLSDDSGIAVFEGDEYLTSALDRRPKFHLYMPDIAVLNGIAWDHMNVFPTFENYTEQFKIFVEKISEGGSLIYFEGDPEVKKTALESSGNFSKIPYNIHGYFQNKTGFYGATHNRVVPLKYSVNTICKTFPQQERSAQQQVSPMMIFTVPFRVLKGHQKGFRNSLKMRRGSSISILRTPPPR